MPPLDDPVRILARELVGVGAGFRVGCAIGVPPQYDGGHGDDGAFRKSLFQCIESRLTPGYFFSGHPRTLLVFLSLTRDYSM